MSAGLAHEFKNAMAALHGYAQFLQSIDHDQKFHQGVIDGATGTLDYIDIPSSNIFTDFYENLAVAKTAHFGASQGFTQLFTNLLG